MSITNIKYKNNQHEPAVVSFQRPSAELFSLSPQTGFIKTSAPTGKVPSLMNSSSNNSNPRSYGQRESGYVEKLLHSYGFIQCCSRKDRLFFHFSEFQGDAESLNIGDIVEFHEACDSVTSKPVAVSIMRVPCAKKSGEILSEKTVVGTVLTPAKPPRPIGGDGEMTSSVDGSVSYEQCGEMFFLTFSMEDVEGNQAMQPGDQVEFYISTDDRNSNLRARKVRKAAADVFQGVVCSMKENFGFIERADVVREIFFHYSEFQGEIEDLHVGDDVEFSVQTRNNKEVAVYVRCMPLGTVVFEDVSLETKKGRILKLPKVAYGRRGSELLSGRITFETKKGPAEIAFGEEAAYDCTLMQGDLVEFYVATDRRDKLQHATNIRLLVDSFSLNREKRERGFVTTLKEGFGFIRCVDRDARMFFHFSEILDVERVPQMQDEIEFTVIQDPTDDTRQIAIRILYLPKGTIAVDKCQLEKYCGTVEKECVNQKHLGQDLNPGIIMYDFNGAKQTIPYSGFVVDGNLPKLGDKVEFQISECHKTKTRKAMNVRVVGRPAGNKEYGFVVTLKDSFGFIETADHEREIFFHFSSYDGDINEFELGDEVEFIISQKGGKVSAENLRLLNRGRLLNEDILPDVMEGKIIKSLSVATSDQTEYSGMIQLVGKDGEAMEEAYPYGIMSLVDKRDMPQKGELVKLQVAISRETGRKRAVRVAPVRRYIHARVESLTGETGTLNYEKDEGKLSFQLSDVQDLSELFVGDEVEFVIVQNLHGCRTAFNVRKTCEKPRPERLISRLRSVTEEQGPKVIATRAPRGPDGSKGFKLSRSSSSLPI